MLKTIGQIATELNTTTRTIRHYEKKGLITPHSLNEAGYRLYSSLESALLEHILVLRALGFKIQDIEHFIISLQDSTPCAKHMGVLIDQQLTAIEKELSRLKRVQHTLERIKFTLKINPQNPLALVTEMGKTFTRNWDAAGNWKDLWNFDRWAKSYDTKVEETTPPPNMGESHEGTQTYNPHQSYTKVLDLVCALVPDHATVCDIGIGTGNLSLPLIRKGCHVIGVDQSRNMLIQAAQKLPQADLRQGNFLALPLSDHSVDAVVTTYAIHHLNEAEKELAIAEMVRVLRPGGVIAIGDNMFTSPQAKLIEKDRLLKLGLSSVWEEIEDEFLGFVTSFEQWFASHGLRTKSQQMDNFTSVLWTLGS